MKTHTILLIEDDDLDKISVERSLKKIGGRYDLHTAFNGKEALELLCSAEKPLLPDVILLDLNMPKMNGLEFLKVLRSDTNLNHLKVFVMTTSAEHEERQMLQELGVSGYVIKPLSYDSNSKNPDSMDAFFQFHLRRILMD
jgi:CheY-like chemotaxis protein